MEGRQPRLLPRDERVQQRDKGELPQRKNNEPTGGNRTSLHQNISILLRRDTRAAIKHQRPKHDQVPSLKGRPHASHKDEAQRRVGN
jgi:hypothetical protein